MNTLRWLHPHWLWVLLVIPLMGLLLFWIERKRERTLSAWVHPRMWGEVLVGFDPSRAKKKIILFCLALAALCVAAARPQYGAREETVTVSGADVLIVLDVSNSMNVEDTVPSRLKRAKKAIRSLSQKLEGDRMGLVVFAGSAMLASPLTTDRPFFDEILESADPSMVLNQGTDLKLALETAAQALNRGSEEAVSAEIPSRIVILVSDGEDLEAAGAQGVEAIQQAHAKIYALAVGSEAGGPVPIRDEAGVLRGYKKDDKRQPVVSRMDAVALDRIASQGGGKSWVLGISENEIDSLLSEMGRLDRVGFGERKTVVYEERYHWPLGLGILLLLLEWAVCLTGTIKKDLVLVLLFISFFPAKVTAVGIGEYLDNRKGIEALEKGDKEEAKRRFGSAQARDPQAPEHVFNEGVIQYQEGDAEGALQSFQQIERGKLEGRAHYNAGSSMAHQGKIPEAVDSYAKAIEWAQAHQDPELETLTRQRLEQLSSDEKKKQEEKKNQSQGQKKNQDQQQGQNQAQQEGNSQEQNRGQTPYNQDKKQEFNSKKYSKEDMERVMSELSQRERQLQKKLQKQNDAPESGGKDW